jgi:hypothetical protein
MPKCWSHDCESSSPKWMESCARYEDRRCRFCRPGLGRADTATCRQQIAEFILGERDRKREPPQNTEPNQNYCNRYRNDRQALPGRETCSQFFNGGKERLPKPRCIPGDDKTCGQNQALCVRQGHFREKQKREHVESGRFLRPITNLSTRLMRELLGGYILPFCQTSIGANEAGYH